MKPRRTVFAEWGALVDVLVLDTLCIAAILAVPAMMPLCVTLMALITLGLPVYVWIRR